VLMIEILLKNWGAFAQRPEATPSAPVRQPSPCLGTVASDSKICYCPQLSPMHNDVVVDTPPLLPPPA
jgi:hypothetical protein